MNRSISILLGLALILGGCGKCPPPCNQQAVSPEVDQNLTSLQKTIPFPLVLPCDQRFNLIDVVEQVRPPRPTYRWQEALSEWRYVKLSYRVGDSAILTVLESNGGLTISGENFFLARRSAAFEESNGQRSLWIDLGDRRVVFESESLTRTELEAIATTISEQVGNTSADCR